MNPPEESGPKLLISRGLPCETVLMCYFSFELVLNIYQKGPKIMLRVLVTYPLDMSVADSMMVVSHIKSFSSLKETRINKSI